jgi:hypothetical protein
LTEVVDSGEWRRSDAWWSLPVPGRDNRLDVSPYCEVADDLHPSRRGRLDQIVKDQLTDIPPGTLSTKVD